MLDSVRNDPVFAGALISTLLGVGVLVEACIHIKRGYLTSYRPVTYLYFKIRAGRPAEYRRFLPGPVAYRALFIARMAAAAILITGLDPRFALPVIGVVTFLETRLYFNFHSAFFVLLSVSLLVAGVDRGGVPYLLSYEPHSPIDSGRVDTGMAMAALLLLALYWGGVRRKWNRSFLSGNVIASTLAFLDDESEHRRHHDSALPQAWLRYLAGVRPGSPLPVLLSSTVLLAEILIPIGLLFSWSQGPAIAAGVVLHGAFFLLFPGTLASFSLITVASYAAVVNVSGTLGL